MTIGEFVLPFMLNRFMLNEPEATVHVTVANTTDLLRSVDEGKLDFALVEGYFSGGDYDYQIYSTEKYIPVAGAAYQLQASSRGKKAASHRRFAFGTHSHQRTGQRYKRGSGTNTGGKKPCGKRFPENP